MRLITYLDAIAQAEHEELFRELGKTLGAELDRRNIVARAIPSRAERRDLHPCRLELELDLRVTSEEALLEQIAKVLAEQEESRFLYGQGKGEALGLAWLAYPEEVALPKDGWPEFKLDHLLALDRELGLDCAIFVSKEIATHAQLQGLDFDGAFVADLRFGRLYVSRAIPSNLGTTRDESQVIGCAAPKFAIARSDEIRVSYLEPVGSQEKDWIRVELEHGITYRETGTRKDVKLRQYRLPIFKGSDIRVETFSDVTGAHVKITHEPTGTVAEGSGAGVLDAQRRALAQLNERLGAARVVAGA